METDRLFIIVKYTIIILLAVVAGIIIGYLGGVYEKNNDFVLLDDNTESIITERDNTRIMVDESLESVGNELADSITRNDNSKELAAEISSLKSEIDGLNQQLAEYNRQSEAIIIESENIITETEEINREITGDLDRAGKEIADSLDIISDIKKQISQGEGYVRPSDQNSPGED